MITFLVLIGLALLLLGYQLGGVEQVKRWLKGEK